MWPGIYPGYKNDDPPIKADNGLSLENTKKLRMLSKLLRDLVFDALDYDDWRKVKHYERMVRTIEDVIGHPKYYI